MPLSVRCPDCSTRLNAPDAAAGKAVKCPKCGARVPVPAPGPEATDEAGPEEAVTAGPKPRPANKEARVAADAPRPARPRRDEPDEDEDDRPRPRRGKTEAGGGKALILALLGIGGLVLLGAGVGAVWWLTRSRPTAAGTGSGGPSASTKDSTKGTGPGGGEPAKPEAAAKVLAPAARFPVSFGEVTAVRLNADGSRAVVANSGTGKAAFQVWELKPAPKMVRELPGSVQAVSPGLERVVRKGDGGVFEVVDLENGSVVARLPLTGLQYHMRSPTSVVVLRRGTREQDGDRAGRLIVHEYDVAAAKAEELFDAALDPSPGTALVKDGRELFLASPKTGRVEVWDLADRKVARSFTLAGLKTADHWGAFAVSPDGKWVAADASGGEAPQVFDGSTGAAVGPTGSAQGFPAFVPGRNMLLGRNTVVIDLKGTVRNGFWAYDIDKRTITACLPGTASGVAFSGDGRTAANWELFKQTEVVIWDLGQLP
jgi:hypothetical protein